VTRLALLDTRIAMDTAEERERREALIGLAEGGEFEKVHAALWPRLVHPDRMTDEALEATVRQMAEDTGPAAFVRQQRAVIGRMNYHMTVVGIRCPTLVLVGEQDAITPVDHARAISTLVPGSRLVVVPDCGHLSTLEQPHAVNTALLLWLQSML
jgi:pimeloyl-ACP methyl ester carboxylesterase